MMRAIKLGLLVLAIASPAFGREHYIEVWNPPEARGGMAPSQAALLAARKADRQAARHRRASLHMAHDVSHNAARRRTVAAMPAPQAPQAPVVTVERRTSEPRYEDIPRQITPEGNVLRIDGRHAQVDVER